MLASNIHAYFSKIELDPAVGWEILETALNEDMSEVMSDKHLRAILADAVSRYIDMSWDEEDNFSTFFTIHVTALLRSTLPLTLDEQRQILGTAAWYQTGEMFRQVRVLLNGHPVLPPSET